ncbi:MAG: tyrosine-type recombinase/integrase, partial [Gammaproteobacteria bacterium]|nr:tyrosine-type recombinase/integrase [Gammaproteobacteria bacterium]
RLLSGRALANDEIGKLFETCADDSPKGARDAALLAVLYGCGLIGGELAGLDIEDFDPDDCSIMVHGKRNKQRTVYLTGRGCGYVEAWLDHRGDDPGPLFCPVDQKGEVRISRLRGESVAYIVKRLRQVAGIDHFSPHDLRRSFVTALLDAGQDVLTVQKLAGHADVTTTARYDRRGEKAKRRAVQSLELPIAA